MCEKSQTVTMPCCLRASFASRTVMAIATQMGLERYFRWRPLIPLPSNVKPLRALGWLNTHQNPMGPCAE